MPILRQHFPVQCRVSGADEENTIGGFCTGLGLIGRGLEAISGAGESVEELGGRPIVEGDDWLLGASEKI